MAIPNRDGTVSAIGLYIGMHWPSMRLGSDAQPWWCIAMHYCDTVWRCAIVMRYRDAVLRCLIAMLYPDAYRDESFDALSW